MGYNGIQWDTMGYNGDIVGHNKRKSHKDADGCFIQ